jgi:uncharacterized repeat protein (TIGR03803 family)
VKVNSQALWLAFLFFMNAAFRLDAQTYAYTSLYSFSPLTANTNADGASPHAGLVLSANLLFGMTYSGGSAGFGTIFKLSAGGSGFTNLYNFTNGVDGANPNSSDVLACSTNALFGVTGFGGTNVPRRGAVFRISADGSDFTNLYSFSGPDGQNPSAGLIISGSTLYGTTYSGGGTSKHGTVFKINTDGSGFTTLYAMSTNDGSGPYAPLLLSGNILFGTTLHGTFGAGSVFRVDTDGNNFTNLYNFTNGIDGSFPYGRLALISNWLYGTTSASGISNYGTVFRINTDGTGFTNLHGFTGGSDAGEPFAGLVVVSNTLYGTALAGVTNLGDVFRINADGTGYTNVYNFTGGSDGGAPGGALILSGNTFYGTANVGGIAYGTNGNGAIFSLTLPVSLGISRSNSSCILSWPSPSTGFAVQTNNNLGTAGWSNFDASAADDGTNKSVVVAPLSDNLSFRLAHP